MKQLEQYEAFIDSFSGATGGVIASLLLYPIENFRTRVQAMSVTDKEETDDGEKGQKKTPESKNILKLLAHLIQTEGVASFYKGLGSALAGTVVSYGVYFWWYRFLKNLVSRFLKTD